MWGRPLLLAAAAVLIWRLAATRPVPARVFALLAMAVSFWVLGGVQRAEISAPDASRYLYVGALFVLLLAVELARSVTVSRGIAALLVMLTGAVVVANLGDLRAGARNLRAQALIARADLGALELAREQIPPGYRAVSFPGIPFVQIDAAHYFSAVKALGSPAASPAEIATMPSEQARAAANGELMPTSRASRCARAAATTASDGADGHRSQGREGDDRRRLRELRRQRGARRTASGPRSSWQVTVPAEASAAHRSKDAPAAVALRRFAGRLPSTAPRSCATGARRLRDRCGQTRTASRSRGSCA